MELSLCELAMVSPSVPSDLSVLSVGDGAMMNGCHSCEMFEDGYIYFRGMCDHRSCLMLVELKLDLTSCQNFDLACVIRDTYLRYPVLSTVVRRLISRCHSRALRHAVVGRQLAFAVNL